MVPLWMWPTPSRAATACGTRVREGPVASLLLAELGRSRFPPACTPCAGDAEAVWTHTHAPDVAAVSFGGSTPFASHIYETGCKHASACRRSEARSNQMVVLPEAESMPRPTPRSGRVRIGRCERCMRSPWSSRWAAVADPPSRPARRASRRRIGPARRTTRRTDGTLITPRDRDRGRPTSTRHDEGAAVVVDGSPLAYEQGCARLLVGCSLYSTNVEARHGSLRRRILGGAEVGRCRSTTTRRLVNANPYGNGVAGLAADGGAARRSKREVQVGMSDQRVDPGFPSRGHSVGGGEGVASRRRAAHVPRGSASTRTRWSQPVGTIFLCLFLRRA